MEALLTLLADKEVMLAVVALLQLIIGKVIKSHPGIANKYIPAFTFGAALLGYTLTPVAAAGGLAVGTAAAATTALTTGVHSLFKNALIPAVKVPFNAIGRMIAKRMPADADPKVVVE